MFVRMIFCSFAILRQNMLEQEVNFYVNEVLSEYVFKI